MIREVDIHRGHQGFTASFFGYVVQDAADLPHHELMKADRTRTQVEPVMDQFAAGLVGKCGVVGTAIGAKSLGTVGGGCSSSVTDMLGSVRRPAGDSSRLQLRQRPRRNQLR